MPPRTIPICFWLVTLLCLSGSSSGAKNPPVAGFPLTISIYNEAGVAPADLAEAEHTASWIFRDAGLAVTWLDCRMQEEASPALESCRDAAVPTHLHLRILRRSVGLIDSAFGISYLTSDGRGCYSDIFLEPIQQLQAHEGFQVPLGNMLGNVAAHEIGHLLLGVNSHSRSGIMRPHWNYDDLANVRKRAMLFTEEESRVIRARLAASSREPRQASIVPRPPAGS